jgi:diadenosine tetraphosphate (Ap4A) HIT family hydrolase
MSHIVFEDARFLVEAAEFCAVPGYLILRLKSEATTLSVLDAEVAGALGRLLAVVVAELELAAGAERVYLLTFAEQDRRFHVHLLPRAAWLAAAWRRARGEGPEAPIDGPALFQWAREVYPAGAALPAEAPSGAAVLARVRRGLAERLP